MTDRCETNHYLIKLYTYRTQFPANRSRHTHSIDCLNDDRGNLAHTEAGRALTPPSYKRISHSACAHRAAFYACAKSSGARVSHCACAKGSNGRKSLWEMQSLDAACLDL